MKNTKRIALSGILSALSVAIIYVSAITEIFSYTGCGIAALVILFLKVEYGMGTASSVYGVVAVILWLIVPDKSVAAVYTFIAGLYPLVKSYFDRITPAVLRVVCKLVAYNAVLAAMYFLGRALFAPEAEAPWLVIATLVMANAVLLLADKLADKLILLYNLKYRQILKRRGIL